MAFVCCKKTDLRSAAVLCITISTARRKVIRLKVHRADEVTQIGAISIGYVVLTHSVP